MASQEFKDFMDATELWHLSKRKGVMNPLLYKEQKALIDRWMSLSGYQSKSYGQIEDLFGGFGDRRPRTVEDLETRPKAAAAKWFESEQTWMDYYFQPEYVYDNWWCAWNVSHQTYATAAKLALRDGFDGIVDVGGSVFSASIFKEFNQSYHQYTIHNFIGTINHDFALFYNSICREYMEKPFDCWTDDQDDSCDADLAIFAEYFEHFQDVDQEFERWDHIPNMVVANGFCVPAYGHYIPIKINGVLHTDRAGADAAFIDLAQRHGYSVEVVPYLAKRVLILKKEEELL